MQFMLHNATALLLCKTCQHSGEAHSEKGKSTNYGAAVREQYSTFLTLKESVLVLTSQKWK